MFFGDQETLEAEPKGTWLVTFADVVALLLAFFVMLFSMSNIETETGIKLSPDCHTPKIQRKTAPDRRRQRTLRLLN